MPLVADTCTPPAPVWSGRLTVPLIVEAPVRIAVVTDAVPLAASVTSCDCVPSPSRLTVTT